LREPLAAALRRSLPCFPSSTAVPVVPATKKALKKLPGNLAVLDRSPDGKVFLVLRYEMPPGLAPGAPRMWAESRLGLLPIEGGEFVPLTKLDEPSGHNFRFSPGGQSILGTMYRKDNSDLFPVLTVFDLKANKRAMVAVPKEARVDAACWSPDGKRIAFVWESQAAFAERNKVLPGPVWPGQEKKPRWIVTVAKPDGSDAKDVYIDAEYRYGSIDWR
jgi:dipeptidyl aminopeptidase/acylaminoacyl peptidase